VHESDTGTGALIHTIAFVTANTRSVLRSNANKTAILVRVYNKPDSAITRIAKWEKRRDKLFLQIFNIIAA
jgi:hypothetical protein